MATRYSYTGSDQRVYPWHRNVDTGTTLVADPGGTYQIEGVGAPVPPNDGRWAEAKTKPATKSKGGDE